MPLGTPKGSGMAEGEWAPGGCRAGVAQQHGVELYSESSGAIGRLEVRQDPFNQLDWRGLRADIGSSAIAVCQVESVCIRMVAVKVRDEQRVGVEGRRVWAEREVWLHQVSGLGAC